MDSGANLTAESKRSGALAQIHAAVVAGYVSGAAVLLWPVVRLISGQPDGVASHVADGLILLGAAFWLQKRRGVIPAVILLAYSATISYFRFLSNGSAVTLALGLILVFVFLGGVLGASRLRPQGSSASETGP